MKTKITTESGCVYIIDENKLCIEYDSNGNVSNSYESLAIKSVPDDIFDLSDVLKLPESNPEIGKRFYLNAKTGSLISAPIVDIEEIE